MSTPLDKRYRLRWDVVVLCEATVDAPNEGYARDMLDDIANNLPQTITLGTGIENVVVMEVVDGI